MYISIHIPKTAGTTLSVIFDYGSHRRILYDYRQLTTMRTDLQPHDPGFEKDRAAARKHREFIVGNFDFLHGHFPYLKYADIFPEGKFITCVRRPIDRLISHYHHVLDERVEGYSLYEDLARGRMDLADMARMPHVGNLQYEYLKGREVKDYDYVFVKEKLAESVYYFQLLFHFRRNDQFMNEGGERSLPVLNPSGLKRIPRKPPERAVVEKADSLLMQDNEIYARALEKYEAQAVRASRLQ